MIAASLIDPIARIGQPFRCARSVVGVLIIASFVGPNARSQEPSDSITEFTRQFCNDCHGPKRQEAMFRIDNLRWNLADAETRDSWELIARYVADGDMPPEKATAHPTDKQRQRFLALLRGAFASADVDAPVGGTPLRRLNRVEYLNTLRDLFEIRMIKLPLSFPEDATSTEFDTMPEGMLLSPAVLEAYHDTATSIASRLVPLDTPSPDGPYAYRSDFDVLEIGGDAGRRWFGPKQAFLKFTGYNHSGWVGALWDSLFVAPSSGVYRVKLLANAQADTGADGKPLRLSFHTFDPTEEQLVKRYRIERATRVAEVNVPKGKPTWIHCDVPIEAGETFHIYCDNRLARDSYPLGDLNRSQVSKALKEIIRRPEPTVELRGLQVEGPVAIPPRVVEFFGTWPPRVDREALRSKLLPLASRAFRRPLTDTERERLVVSVLNHRQVTGSPELAWHYAVRRVLCSPAFLYREAESHASAGGNAAVTEPERAKLLSQFALASRLSYFLWSTLPDKELLDAAATGTLSDPETIAKQTRRLIADPRSQQFIQHFTGQWLGNRAVAAINVCDNRYRWDDNVRYGFLRSTEMFFEEILRENLPISTFIDSDFTYANSAMRVIWGIKDARDKNLDAVAARQRQSLVWPEPDRIDFTNPAPGTPEHVLARRGVLGLPGVLTVTGDGVESSPILRGVWVLGNLFGQHPPPPPENVPALDIDTSRATTVRQTLAAHQKVESCAKCHRDIDPLGLALENYDAAGGWRHNYSGGTNPIDASATTSDGNQLNGAGSIRQLLLEQPKVFTRCLLTKLMEYAAGRSLSIGDRRVAERLVRETPPGGYRFADLIVAVTTSEVFMTK